MAQWRRQWYEGTGGGTDPLMPFGVTQVGPVSFNNNATLPTYNRTFAIRTGQTGGFGYLPNARWPHTFLAAAFDLPNPPGTACYYGCVHLFAKRVIGRRLASAALTHAYPRRADVAAAADAPHATTASCDGPLLVINFSVGSPGVVDVASDGLLQPNCTTGLMLQTGGDGWTHNVSIAAFTPFAVTLRVAGGRGVVLAVRYAFEDLPCPYMGCAFYSKEGMPVLPFELSCS